MINKTALLTTFLISFASIVLGQKLNQNWENDLATAIQEFKNCKNPGNANVNPCSKYIGESIKVVYGVNDFYSNDLGRYMTGTEIAKLLESDTRWTKLGPAYEQNNLNKAQETANAGKAALAVYIGEDQLGNVAIILPGEVKASGSWGLSVPNSAAFFMHSPARSYYNKTLSYAFTRNMIKDVMIFVRK